LRKTMVSSDFKASNVIRINELAHEARMLEQLINLNQPQT
jgi:hypothetical protein